MVADAEAWFAADLRHAGVPHTPIHQGLRFRPRRLRLSSEYDFPRFPLAVQIIHTEGFCISSI
jgi:hypothetical protein